MNQPVTARERLQTEPCQDSKPLRMSDSCGDLRLKTEPFEPEVKQTPTKSIKKGLGKFGTKLGSEHLLVGGGGYRTPTKENYASTGKLKNLPHNHTIYSNTPLVSKQKTLLGNFVNSGQTTEILRQKIFERRLKTETRAKEEQILDSMLETKNHPWKRTLTKTMSKAAKKFDGSWSIFSQRQNPNYDPTQKIDPAKWDVKKPDLLNFMERHRKDIARDESLLKGLQDLKGSTQFNNRWPASQKFKVVPDKFVYNDYHLKITGPGYSRNYESNGKPFIR